MILSNSVATIDFQAEITTPSRSEVSYKKYRSALEFDFRTDSRSYADAMKNPTGFVVTKYQVTQIINEKGSK